jgi:hypothetical protein
VLGKLQEYLYLWQLPFIGVFLVGWILGGGYLLRGSVRKALPEMRRRITLGRCVLVSILSGTTAMGAGIAVYLLVNGLGEKIDADLQIVGVIAAIPVAAVMAVLSVYATFHLSLAKSARVLAPTAAMVVVLGGVLGSVTGVLAYGIHQRQVRERTSLGNLQKVSQALSEYEGQKFSLPADLKTLVSGNYLLTRYLRSASIPGRDVGFFYLPSEWSPGDQTSLKILICELPPVLAANRRTLLFVNGERTFADKDELQALMERPENAEFAKAFEAATAQ